MIRNSKLRMVPNNSIILFILWLISILLFDISFGPALEASKDLKYDSAIVYLTSIAAAVTIWNIMMLCVDKRIAVLVSTVGFCSIHLYAISLEKMPLYWLRVMLLDMTPLKWMVLTFLFLFIIGMAELLHSCSRQYIVFVTMIFASILFSVTTIHQVLPHINLRIVPYPSGIFITSLAFSMFLAGFHEYLRSLSQYISMEINGGANEN